MPTNSSQDIRSFLEARIAELEEDLGALRRALGALDGASGVAPRGRAAAQNQAKPRRRRSTGGRAARTSSQVVPAGKLEQLLRQSDGLTTSALAEETDGDRQQVLRLLKELEAAGKARRSGQRRATRWHLVDNTDSTVDDEEAQIQRRAAELAKLVA